MLNSGTILQNRYQIIQRIGGRGMGKPRDLYDVWLLLNKGVGIDRVLINDKLEA